MKIVVSFMLALALTGCVSAQNQQALKTNQDACNGGNQDACTAAGYQAQANQQEQQANSAAAAGIGAALLGGAIAGAAIANAQPVYVTPVYRPVFLRYR